jgi:uncharacterized protein YbjT (DUF2867 family)
MTVIVRKKATVVAAGPRFRPTEEAAMAHTVLAVGASGTFAGLVVPALVARGASVRGFIQDHAKSTKVHSAGATDVAVGDLRDRESVQKALSGVTSVFYIAPAFMADEAETGKAFVAAAVQAGVRRIVFSSVIHPVLSTLVNHSAKAPVEEAILNSGLECTILQPTLYFQNYARSWREIVKTGVLSEPWSIETRFSRVDYRDVAEVAAIALTEDRLLYGTFELSSEGRFNRTDVAGLIGEILSRKIDARRTDPGSLADAAKPMRLMFEHYEHHGLLGNPITLRAILGREPRTIRTYFEELAGLKEAA